MTISVLGSGSWGTALALVLARNGHEVSLIGRDSDSLASLSKDRENSRYLPGFALPSELHVLELEEAPPRCDITIIAVPSAAVHQVTKVAKNSPLVVVASKGLAPGGDALLSDLVSTECPDSKIVVLSGPNLAVELAQGVPTIAVAASRDETSACIVRDAFHCRSYRVYVTDDVYGVEIAGALKNVIAIAAGMSDGLGFGDNTKGALLARGLNEMARIGLALGARIETYLGIAGVGDLFATANSQLSRNYRVGFGLGQGKSIHTILSDIGQVAEGVPTTDLAVNMAHKLGLEVPITTVVQSVMKGTIEPRSAVWQLMERTPKKEGFESLLPRS